jgi:hypothetical protein
MRSPDLHFFGTKVKSPAGFPLEINVPSGFEHPFPSIKTNPNDKIEMLVAMRIASLATNGLFPAVGAAV